MVKNLPVSAGDAGLVPGEGNGNPLQYCCLGKIMDREARRATVHEVAKELDITYRLNNTSGDNKTNVR